MRNIRIAPRDEWVSNQPSVPQRPRSTGRSRLRDWLATAPILLLIPALIVPMLVTSAAGGIRLTVDPGTAASGTTVTVIGSGFPKLSTGTIALDDSSAILASYGANRSGKFRVKITVPTSVTIGAHTVLALDAGGAVVSQVGMSIASPTATPTPVPTAAPTATPTPVPTAAPTTSATFHVALSGSDSNDGSSARPWRTIQRAADLVPAGSTVQVHGGTYVGFTISRSGTSSAPITVAGAPGETAIIRGDSSHTNVIRVTGAHDVIVRNLSVTGAPAQWGSGIRVDNGSYRVSVLDNTIHENRSFGVKLQGVGQVTIRGNDIFKNETGIEVSGGGADVLIDANAIHDHDRMVVNTIGGYDDRGANAIVFYHSSGPTTVTNNRIWDNRAASYDYGYDGGAFEIYAASGIWIEGNKTSNNENVIETGTDGAPCSNNTFVRNVSYGGAKTGPTMGLILRCASNMLVAHNSFYDLDRFVFDINASASAFGGSIDGLRILNNAARQTTDKVYSIDSALPSSVQIDFGLVSNASGGSIAYVYGKGNTSSLATFVSWTGREPNGAQADPRFVAPASGDMRLQSVSPAIDKATILASVSSQYNGTGPDVGRFEYGD